MVLNPSLGFNCIYCSRIRSSRSGKYLDRPDRDFEYPLLRSAACRIVVRTVESGRFKYSEISAPVRPPSLAPRTKPLL
jgi:hypothetical protein